MLQQLCDDTSNNVLIENNGVIPEWGCNPFSRNLIVTACKQSLGQGNIFTPVSHSVGKGGGGFPACITGHITRVVCLWGRGGGSASTGVCIQGESASGGAPFRGVCLHGVGIQGGLPPGVGGLGRPSPKHYRIWSTSRWYASYWNAFLFSIRTVSGDTHTSIQTKCTDDFESVVTTNGKII